MATGNYSFVRFGVKRAAGSFGATAEPGTVPPNSATLQNAWRTQGKFTGRISAGNWTFSIPLIASSAGGSFDGRIRMRVWKSSEPSGLYADGTDAFTQITSSAHDGSLVANLATGVAQVSSATFALGDVDLYDEYVFIHFALEVTGSGAGGTDDALVRVGSDSYLQTADFTEGKSFFPDAATASSSNHGEMVDGSAPASAVMSTGWAMGAGIAGLYSRMAYGSERAAGTFGAAAQPSGAPDNSLGDCFRSTSALTCGFDSGTWKARIQLRSDTAGGFADVYVEARLWRSGSQDGSSATEITSGAVESLIVNNVSSTERTSIVTFSGLPSVTLSGEYLFLQLALRVNNVTGIGGSDDVHIYKGTGCCLSTTRLVVSGAVASTAATPVLASSGSPIVAGALAADAVLALLASSGSPVVAGLVGGTTALPALVATGDVLSRERPSVFGAWPRWRRYR